MQHGNIGFEKTFEEQPTTFSVVLPRLSCLFSAARLHLICLVWVVQLYGIIISIAC